MITGLSAFLLFLWFLAEWPSFIRMLERQTSNPDSASAKIRMARFRAGLNPWLKSDDKE